jgi:hypothetical protein
MPERPKSNQNWQRRDFNTATHKFRLDIANPSMGVNGSDVYNFYAVSDKNEVFLMGLSEGGLAKIYNDQSLEIVAGQKNKSTGVDIKIIGKNGDICITAEKDGSIRIRGKNIILDADENIELRAGKSITCKADAGKILLKAQQADCDALLGNLPPVESTFGGLTFAGTYVGQDVLEKAYSDGLPQCDPEPIKTEGEISSAAGTEAEIVGGNIKETPTEQLSVGESNSETINSAAMERDLVESQQARALQQGKTINQGNTKTSFTIY